MTWTEKQLEEAVRVVKRSTPMRKALDGFTIGCRPLQSWWGHWETDGSIVRRRTILALINRRLIYFYGNRWKLTAFGWVVKQKVKA